MKKNISLKKIYSFMKWESLVYEDQPTSLLAQSAGRKAFQITLVSLTLLEDSRMIEPQ